MWKVREKHRHVTRLLQTGNVKFHECTTGSHCIESTWYKAPLRMSEREGGRGWQPRSYIRRNIQRIHFSQRAISQKISLIGQKTQIKNFTTLHFKRSLKCAFGIWSECVLQILPAKLNESSGHNVHRTSSQHTSHT
jgi:hypothetical protein